MKIKKPYLPANIRAGVTAKNAAEWLKNNYSFAPVQFQIEIDSFDHGRDICGNGTAHYRVLLMCEDQSGREYCPLTIVESGKRREQVGYGGCNQAAIYALEQLGYKVDLTGAGSYDHLGAKTYPLIGFWVQS